MDVRYFDTESGFDKLTVNGVEYSGSNGPQGVIPHGEITWSSEARLQAVLQMQGSTYSFLVVRVTCRLALGS